MSSMRGGLSKDAANRATQLANLKPNAHSTHGVYDLRRTKPLAEEHTVALREAFPLADDRLLAAQAQRAAAIDLAWAWICERGLVRTKAGDPFGVVKLWRMLLNDSDQAHKTIVEQQREREGGPSDRQRLEEAEAKYHHLPQANGKDGNDG